MPLAPIKFNLSINIQNKQMHFENHVVGFEGTGVYLSTGGKG